jgi:hypothetical protein
VEIILFTTASRTTLGPTQSPIQWVLGALSLGVKRPGCEAGHSPPSSADVKELVELYLHSPSTPSWRGAQLRKSTGTTILYYTILYYTILYYTILYYTTLHYATLRYAILYYTILYFTLLYSTLLYSTLLYSTLLCLSSRTEEKTQEMIFSMT